MRKRFKDVVEDIPRYAKKPKLMENFLAYDDPLRKSIPTNLDYCKNLDKMFLLSRIIYQKSPMWVGFNALNVPETLAI